MSPQQRLLVLGGNGYVGQNICDAAVASGKFIVKSLSRSGRPTNPNPQLKGLSNVEWIEGDVFDEGSRDDALKGVDSVVSTIGAFGSNEFMDRICGDATIQAVESAAARSVSRFGFISSAQVGKLNLSPSTPMYGYFHGKSRAEEAIRKAFPESHAILRPGFVYGPRMIGSIGPVPLQLIGVPVSAIGTRLGPVSSLLQCVPFIGTELSSMVPVQSVAQATIQSLLEPQEGKLLTAEDIRNF
mmetsp:Transcript_17294/g.25347  ORF Transcript_17294/g.25347 Transcript_17294/m.25347 type:complete len:242 (-) Transcript_17294:535-1260(-)|eukprot:CAMPEP_0195513712 /NCGR_PEP_ID=MMETSP0794_2-20130614/5304_1 /TAXON_ID=515487 /ORGANISM="Stephanopyxis turris, Strain CCMP 815" /LENGTH=241 /DNA_ID=CAMNT_0040641793 /DNA_START=123 /DNA_END=848 /DNA_ORIENTATION=-